MNKSIKVLSFFLVFNMSCTYSMNISSVPDEILEHIITYAGHASSETKIIRTYLELKLVCKKWNKLISSPKIIKTIQQYFDDRLTRCLGDHGAKPRQVSFCLKMGANPNAQSPQNEIPLHIVIRYLGVHPDYQIQIIKLLLENKADPNKSEPSGESPLSIAISKHSPENNVNTQPIISLLLQYGADKNKPSSQRGQTPLELAHSKGISGILTQKSSCNRVVATFCKLFHILIKHKNSSYY